MHITRRRLLAAPAALSAGLLPGSLLAALEAQTPPMADLSTWDAVRAQFVLDPEWMHFASFFIASHPAPVRAAIEGYRRAIDRNPFVTVEHGMFSEGADNLHVQVVRPFGEHAVLDGDEGIAVDRTPVALDRRAHRRRMAGDEEAGEVHPLRIQHELGTDRVPGGEVRHGRGLRFQRGQQAARQQAGGQGGRGREQATSGDVHGPTRVMARWGRWWVNVGSGRGRSGNPRLHY